jgi:bacillithiol system protein YtxJ
LQQIIDEQGMGRPSQAELAILYKHSPTCGVCAAALGEVEVFISQHRDVDVYIIDVLARRALSQRIAARAGMRHQSPQITLFQQGPPRWDESHWGITGAALAEQFKLIRR